MHMGAALAAAGSAVDRVIKVNACLVDMAELEAFNEEACGAFFGAHKPARATVAAAQPGSDAPTTPLHGRGKKENDLKASRRA